MDGRLSLLGNLDREMFLGETYGHLMGLPFGLPAGVTSNATTGVPVNGAKGYARGCLFFNPKNGQLYKNSGTTTSAVWEAVQTAAAGSSRQASGSAALDGTNPTPVVTGLTTITSAIVTLRGNAAPGVGTSVLTTGISAGTLSVYAWKPTDATNPTLIASTGTETFDWAAWGT